MEIIQKFSHPQSHGHHLSERPAASDAVLTDLYDHSWGGNRAEWTRISMHEPHYTWSHRLGFGLLIYLFSDPLLQQYKLALINCSDISQQLEASYPKLFFAAGSLHLLPKCRFCQHATPGREKDRQP